jgi:hypothetical protein
VLEVAALDRAGVLLDRAGAALEVAELAALEGVQLRTWQGPHPPWRAGARVVSVGRR